MLFFFNKQTKVHLFASMSNMNKVKNTQYPAPWTGYFSVEQFKR